MRNIPFAFIDEATVDRIKAADKQRIDGFARLAETQRLMRGLPVLPKDRFWKSAWKRLVAFLEHAMEMSGPNSIANLERVLRNAQNGRSGQAPRRRV
jgi:hypothetical protein